MPRTSLRSLRSRRPAARLLGIKPDGLTPIPAAVAAPVGYTGFGSGRKVAAADVDLVARVVGGRPPMLHKAYPGTVAACTAVAACIPGKHGGRSRAPGRRAVPNRPHQRRHGGAGPGGGRRRHLESRAGLLRPHGASARRGQHVRAPPGTHRRRLMTERMLALR